MENAGLGAVSFHISLPVALLLVAGRGGVIFLVWKIAKLIWLAISS